MLFASPLWLIGLIFWAGLVLWLLLRRRETTDVSFLPLWQLSSTRPVKHPRVGLPPLALLLLLLAIAAALLGASEPRWEKGSVVRGTTAVPQAAITWLAASDRPHPQVMVQVTTAHFDRPTVELNVTSGEQHSRQEINVAASASKNVFVDLNSLNENVAASLSNSPIISIKRTGRPIDIAADAKVPAPLRRLIDLTQQQRGPTRGNQLQIAVDSALTSDRPGIVLSPPTTDVQTHWTVMDEPLTRDVDWSELNGGCAVDPAWEPLVFSGERVLLARREQPPLQILSSVATVDWPSRTSFVVFWTHAVEMLAGGNGEFERYHSQLLDPTPAPAAAISKSRDLSPAFYLLALAMLGGAGVFVPKQSIPYTARHVEPAALLRTAREQATHPDR